MPGFYSLTAPMVTPEDQKRELERMPPEELAVLRSDLRKVGLGARSGSSSSATGSSSSDESTSATSESTSSSSNSDADEKRMRDALVAA